MCLVNDNNDLSRFPRIDCDIRIIGRHIRHYEKADSQLTNFRSERLLSRVTYIKSVKVDLPDQTLINQIVRTLELSIKRFWTPRIGISPHHTATVNYRKAGILSAPAR